MGRQVAGVHTVTTAGRQQVSRGTASKTAPYKAGLFAEVSLCLTVAMHVHSWQAASLQRHCKQTGASQSWSHCSGESQNYTPYKVAGLVVTALRQRECCCVAGQSCRKSLSIKQQSVQMHFVRRYSTYPFPPSPLHTPKLPLSPPVGFFLHSLHWPTLLAARITCALSAPGTAT